MTEVIYHGYNYYTISDGTRLRCPCTHKYILKNKPHGIPISEEQQLELIRKYNDGVPLVRLTKDYNISIYFIRMIIDKHKTEKKTTPDAKCISTKN